MVAEMEKSNTRTDTCWNDSDGKKLGRKRHTSLVISVSTPNPTWSGPRSGLHKRNVWYSRKIIIPNSWSRMRTGRPKDRVSVPCSRNTFTYTAERL